MSSPTPLRPLTTNDNWQPQSTTPLRISKRDSPTSETAPSTRISLQRRNSSSWKHVIEGGRVSKSPFKILGKASGIPVPSKTNTNSPVLAMLARKASGEKRPRPVSMSEQAENEHPALRKRRQSQGLQGLANRKPVTKSPFKSSNEDEKHLAEAEHDADADDDVPPPPPPKERFDRFQSGRSSPSPHRGSPSPVRPSLVSRRLHGPRTSSMSKRQRRKTVTFDETCDVMEYDVEEDSGSQPFDWVTDEDNDNDDDDEEHDDHDNEHDKPTAADGDDPDDLEPQDTAARGPLRVQNADAADNALPALGEDSITGLVNSMLQDARPQTPPQDEHALPEDLETEAGVPYGRTHHAERVAAVHQQQKADLELAAPEHITFPLANAATSTPQGSRAGTPIGSVSPGSHIPLGRSTHSERIKAHKEKEAAEEEEDVRMLPPSPSPAKPRNSTDRVPNEGLIPRFSLDVNKPTPSPPISVDRGDFFGAAQTQNGVEREEDAEEDLVVTAEEANKENSMDAPSHSGVSSSNVIFDMDLESEKTDPRSSTESSNAPSILTPPTSPPQRLYMNHANGSKDSLLTRPFGMSQNNGSRDSLLGRSFGMSQANGSRDSLLGRSPSPFARSGSPAVYSPFTGSPSLVRAPQSRSGSPFVRADSPLLRTIPRMGSATDINTPTGSPSGRSPRITRDSVQKILEKKRSFDSPLREKGDSPFAGPPLGDPSVDSPASSPSKRPVSRALTRDNPTHDGVMTLNPADKAEGPPRPELIARAASFDVAEGEGGRPKDTAEDPDDLGFVHLGDMKSALDRLMADVAGEAKMSPDGKPAGLKIEAVTEGVKARRHSLPDADTSGPSRDASSSEDAMDVEESTRAEAPKRDSMMHIDLPSMGPETLLSTGFTSPPVVDPQPPSRATSPQPLSRATSPRPPLVKDAIKTREELIKAKKREARLREEEMEDEADTSTEYFAPRRPAPSRRRSMSASDTNAVYDHRVRRRANTISDGGLLDAVPIDDEEDPLADSIDRELRRLKGPGHSKYHVRQRSETIYATSDISHPNLPSEVAKMRAWRTVRRPSDMNEYAQQLKQLRAQENSGGKAYGKVFVKVRGIKLHNLPLPSQTSFVSCTLNNGIHFVTTPECELLPETRIDQEFELIEHNKLEFTLTIKVKRDPHIIAQFKAATQLPPAPPPVPQPSPAPRPVSRSGFRSFFNSGKKPPKAIAAPPPPRPAAAPPRALPENLARYLKSDGTLARAFVAFKDIGRLCDAKLFETSYPLIGQKTADTPNAEPKTVQVGEIVLQIFRLPPLPGIPPEGLPQSLEECHRGLRHVQWHKEVYFEGTLTQNGGGCTSWRRRHFRVIGASLIAFNDVTKRAITTIDLKKALAIEDDEVTRNELLSPASAVSARSSRYVEFDVPYGVERSFRLLFPNDQEIIFFADTDEEKDKWLEVLRALVGRIPPNPLWAELLWQRQQDSGKPLPDPLPSAPSPVPG